IFNGKANFFKAVFLHKVQFGNSSFNDAADFNAVKFLDGALFWNVVFAAGASFLEATLRGTADFSNAVFGDGRNDAIADFRSVNFEESGKILFHMVNKDAVKGLR